MSAPGHRILLVIGKMGWAGAETQLAHLALDLKAAGHSVRLLALADRTPEMEPLEAAGVETVALGGRGPATKLRGLPAVVRHARWAEVVHCTGWDGTLWGRLGGILARRPVLFTEHTPGRELQTTPEGASRQRAIAIHNRLLGRFTYAAIVVGAWQKELLVGEGVRPGSIVHIPNGVPIAALREEAATGSGRAGLGIPEDAKVIVQIARFSIQKGQSVTLAATAALRDGLGDVRLLFVGDGDEEARVRAEVAALGGTDWVHFLGRRGDVPALFGLADLAVLPSTGEGLPMSLIEAIAVGTPVVATDVGDVGWLLERSGGGIAVPVGDAAAFERACERVLGDSAVHASLVAAGAAGIGEFDAKLMSERYETVFDAAIAGAPVPTELPAAATPGR
jgi:glycosyltransferase involved in cell wall biosynthesis